MPVAGSPGKRAAWLAAGLLIVFAVGREFLRSPADQGPARFPHAKLATPSRAQAGSPEEPDVLDLLALPSGAVAADHVVREVDAQHRLHVRFVRITRENPTESKGALLSELADDEGFEAMLARLKDDPQFDKELEPAREEARKLAARAPLPEAAASPESSLLLARGPAGSSRGLAGAASDSRAAGGGRGGSGRVGRLRLARDVRGAGPSGPVAYSRGVGPSAGAAAFDRISGASAPTRYASPGAEEPSGRPDERRVGRTLNAGNEAHNVSVSLAPAVNADSEMMKRLLEQYPFLAGLTDAERRMIVQHIGEDGLWGACFRLNLYARCDDACAGAGSKCLRVSGWDSCLEYKNNDTAACVAACPLQPGCHVPPGLGGGPTGTDTGTGTGTGTGPAPSCASLCGGWQGGGCGEGGCPSNQRLRTRSCPASAGCSQTDCWQDGSGCEN